LSIAGVSLWSSDDHGDHFAPIASGTIGGRCEFGYAMNSDPTGGRLACFMLDGKAGIMADGGKTWRSVVNKEWKPKLPGQWLCIGFDPQARILYASCIGNPAFRLRLK